jgi:hypothetical protein
MPMFRSASFKSGLNVWMPVVGGMSLFSSAKVALMMLVRPLTASPCPTLGLLEPTSNFDLEAVAKAFDRALISIGSPTGVPVP